MHEEATDIEKCCIKKKKRTKEVRSLLHNWAETTKNYKNNTIIIRVTKYLG